MSQQGYFANRMLASKHFVNFARNTPNGGNWMSLNTSKGFWTGLSSCLVRTTDVMLLLSGAQLARRPVPAHCDATAWVERHSVSSQFYFYSLDSLPSWAHPELTSSRSLSHVLAHKFTFILSLQISLAQITLKASPRNVKMLGTICALWNVKDNGSAWGTHRAIRTVLSPIVWRALLKDEPNSMKSAAKRWVHLGWELFSEEDMVCVTSNWIPPVKRERANLVVDSDWLQFVWPT